MKKTLGDAVIRSLEPGTYFDTRTPAFGIRVGAHRKTWIVTRGRGRTVVTLGHYPAISLKEAREKAYAVFLGPEEVHKSKVTVENALREFLGQKGRWRPHTLAVMSGNLRRFRWTGHLASITKRDILQVLDAIEGRSARAHALKDARTFFNWCVGRYIEHSPVAGIRMERQVSRDRVLTDAELKQVWIACDAAGAFGDIVRLLILTGQRRTEVGSLQWSWVGTEQMTWPAVVTKNGREHRLPLGERAQRIVERNTNKTPFVFPARMRANDQVPRPFSGWSKSLAALQAASATANWTLHDLRRTFATGLARLGTPIHVIEKLLNHLSGAFAGVAGTYNRFDYWAEQQTALRAWEGFVYALSVQVPEEGNLLSAAAATSTPDATSVGQTPDDPKFSRGKARNQPRH